MERAYTHGGSHMLANFSPPRRLALALFPLLVAAVILVALIQTTGAEQPGPSAMPENPREPSCYDGSTPTPVPKRYVGPPSHYQGMTPDEITEHHNQARQAWQQKYETWLADFVASGFDARALDRAEKMATYNSSARDLGSAVREADVIVSGQVTKVVWIPGFGKVTFKVGNLIKGVEYAEDGAIELIMGGGPSPTSDYCFRSAKLAEDVNAPILLEGDKAVLFLQQDTKERLWVQSWSGHYLVKNGKIEALNGNDFKYSVDGFPFDVFIKVIQSLLDP
jgi:hypothetical protein